MELEFIEYQPRKIVNIHRHVDGPWFWDKYSAHPYVGCRSGCEFCYVRGNKYCGRSGPAGFDTRIRVKTNAPELLRKELSRLAPDVIGCGDWQQPAESRYLLSRAMLEVVLELGFPLFIVERSPLLTRDLDLLVEINRRSNVRVAISLSNVDPDLKRVFEPRSPSLRRRLQTMAALAGAGIMVGVALMPIIPFAGHDRAHLEEAIRAAMDHGGSFVMAGGLTMDGEQAERTLAAARRLDPGLEERFRRLYRWEEGKSPAYAPPAVYRARLGVLVKEICARYGLPDRQPRYIPPGPLAINKRVAERLSLRTYDLELAQEHPSRIWPYRKAAWAVDEWPESLTAILETRGEAGLSKMPGVDKHVAEEIAGWLREDAGIS